MRKLIILILLTFSSLVCFCQDDEEITLFNSKGKAIAYQDAGQWHIYGFNGIHLGWFEKGIIYNHEGDAEGFIKGATTQYTEYEPYKSYKEYKPYKSYREYAPYKPYFSNSFSTTPLSIFLMAGSSE